MDKYKATFLDILNFFIVHCDCKFACEDIKDMIIAADTILRDVPIISKPRHRYFIFYCVVKIIMPKLELNVITLPELLDNLQIYFNNGPELL